MAAVKRLDLPPPSAGLIGTSWFARSPPLPQNTTELGLLTRIGIPFASTTRSSTKTNAALVRSGESATGTALPAEPPD
jgi:hypothetical protein